MARGIGGEDGPSLWMFIAVLAVWATVRSALTSAKNSVVDGLGIGQNTAGPLQAETSSEIQTMEDEVKSWPVSWSSLPRPKTYYSNIASKLWNEVKASVNIDEALMVDLCRPLTKNELFAVAKLFGVRESSSLGFTTWSGHIFKAFDLALAGMFKSSEMAEMKRIWSVTRLW